MDTYNFNAELKAQKKLDTSKLEGFDMTIYYKSFQQNLRTLRNSEGMSAKELSRKCGLRNQKRIIDLEEGRGKPSFEEVVKICEFLQVSIDNMINGTCIISTDWQ